MTSALKNLIVLAAWAGASAVAQASPMTLTAAGVGEGFTLSTFASGFPSLSGIGPLGVGFPSSGGVLITDWNDGVVRKFATDVDNQLYAASTLAAGAVFGTDNEQTIFNLGGQLYMSQTANGQVIQINDDGSLKPGFSAAVPGAEGIVRNPANGHLLVASCSASGGIWDVDPGSGASFLLIPTVVNACNDGLSISPDGKTVFVAVQGNGVHGYDIATTAQVLFLSNAQIADPDGTAMGTGTLANKLFINTNDGELWEADLADINSPILTLIANGGSRGDFVTVDPNNGTLLIAQTDSILRLTPPAGGSFGVPEPATLALCGIGLALLTARRRRRG